MAKKITIKNGEGKSITFTITRNKVAVDLTGSTFRFIVKAIPSSSTYLVDKQDADFTKASIALGIVKTIIPASENTADLLPPLTYIGELRTTITADTDVDKSYDIPFTVEPSE